MWFKRARTDKKKHGLRRINKNDRFSLHFFVIAVVVVVVGAGGGSAIKEGAIKIDRSVTIGVHSRSVVRAGERATLVREREESGWILSFLFPSFCVSVVPPPMLRRRLKTVLFRKAGCYLRGDVLGLLETGCRLISRSPRFRYVYPSLSPSCPESGHLEASDRVQLSFFGTDLASDTPKPRHRDAGQWATDTGQNCGS